MKIENLEEFLKKQHGENIWAFASGLLGYSYAFFLLGRGGGFRCAFFFLLGALGFLAYQLEELALEELEKINRLYKNRKIARKSKNRRP